MITKLCIDIPFSSNQFVIKRCVYFYLHFLKSKCRQDTNYIAFGFPVVVITTTSGFCLNERIGCPAESSSLGALVVVGLTALNALGGHKPISMMASPFQWITISMTLCKTAVTPMLTSGVITVLLQAIDMWLSFCDFFLLYVCFAKLSAAFTQWVNSVPPYVRKLHFMYEVIRTSGKYRWNIYRTSSKCRWSIYRTSRKRRGTLPIVHKVERSSPTVLQ